MTPFLLDHIIILLPPQLLHNLPPSLTTAFTITPGGRHADNLTTNKLITFRDGSYIELIAFTNPDPSTYKNHWWGQKKPESIIDFAFTSRDTTDEGLKVLFEELEKRVRKEGLDSDGGFGYEKPKEGGRVRDDGVEIKWKVTFPKPSVTRGEMPFFCHDITDRSLRVPGKEENTTHPCDAIRVKSLSIIVAEDRVDELVRRYEALLGVENVKEGRWGARCVVGMVNGLVGSVEVVVFVRGPGEEWERRRVEERGYLIGELVLGGEHSRGDAKGQLSLERIDLDLDLGGLFVETWVPSETNE